jgi:hypothetical protein
MRRRSDKVFQTRHGHSVLKIADIVSRFPLLHAYGVGFEVFREMPDHVRMRAMDFAKFTLAYALDDEIDSAIMFFKVMRRKNTLPGKHQVRCSYLIRMYHHWRRLSGTHVSAMPYGAMMVGALMLGQRVTAVPTLKPDALISMHEGQFKRMEQYLIKNYDLTEGKRREKYFLGFGNENREGEQGN